MYRDKQGGIMDARVTLFYDWSLFRALTCLAAISLLTGYSSETIMFAARLMDWRDHQRRA
jgi:hypothetical protein